MNDRASFTKLAQALSPWAQQLVFVGGWAHRLYRLHPKAARLQYPPLATLDADVAFADRERLEGSIKTRLQEAGFQEQLTGSHRPPVSQYTLGNEDSGGFYAEFLTPLTGRSTTREGEAIATLAKAGITAQRLRYLEILLHAPWNVTLDNEWGAASAIELRIPNPVSFIIQKLLIHEDRARGKRAQDILYIHDTLELFGADIDDLAAIWQNEVRGKMHSNWVKKALQTRDTLFGQLNDWVRNAAAIPQDRQLNPERMRAICQAALAEVLD